MSDALPGMAYDTLANDVYPFVEGISRPQIVPIVRMAVITVCQESGILNRTIELEWKGPGEYTMDHSGFVFLRLMAGWVRKPNVFHNRLDPKWLANLRRCPDSTILVMPDDDLSSPTGHYPFDIKSLHLRYSLTPSPDSTEFPRLLYDMNPRLLVVAALAQMGPFIKEGNRRVSYGSTYKMEYEELIREAKAREDYQGSFGERNPRPMWDDSLGPFLPDYFYY